MPVITPTTDRYIQNKENDKKYHDKEVVNNLVKKIKKQRAKFISI